MAQAAGETTATGLSKTQIGTLRSYPDAAAALPAPEETWTFSDVDALSISALRVFEDRGLITLVERRPATANRWRTTQETWAFVSGRERRALPCGHTKVRNLRHGGYGCRTCGTEYDRETVKKALSGQQTPR